MDTISTHHQVEPDYNDRPAILHYMRRESLGAGSLGLLYSALGKIFLPDDPQRARQYHDEMLDRQLARDAHRLFIEGTPIFRPALTLNEWE
jgi:hypothetical protein